MKLQDKHPNQAITELKENIKALASSPILKPLFFESFIQLSIINETQVLQDDIIPSLIAKSETSKLAFNTLKRIAAHFEIHNKTKPNVLSLWLTDYLHGNREEPKFGRTGPKKSQIEQSVLLHLVMSIASKYKIPIWPKETKGKNECVLELISIACRELKYQGIKVPYPTTLGAMEKRYIVAKKLLKVK